MAKAELVRQDFYVYVLFHPVTGHPFYVGKGTRGRMDDHLKGDRNNADKIAIISEAKEAGLDVPRVKVATGMSEAEAFSAEIVWIAAIGRMPNGPLVNRVDGGANPPSNSGKRHSEVTKAKMRATALAIGQRPTKACIDAMVSSRRGSPAPMTEQGRLRRSASLKAVQRTSKWLANMSAALKGRPVSENTQRGKARWLETVRAQRSATCPICSASFMKNRKKQVFCSMTCSATDTARRRFGNDGGIDGRRQSGR